MKTRTVFLISALTFLWSASKSQAQAVPGGNEPWTALWITAVDTPARDEAVLHFRKIIQVANPPAHFLVDVSADNQFLFEVNQRRVGTGPSRSDLAHWKYETYDIAPMLHAGRNVLSATVWNFGVNSAIAQMSDRIGFLLHGRDLEHVADTNPSWEVEVEKGIRTLQPEMNNYYAASPGERLDGTAFDWSWSSGSAASKWTKAISLGRGAMIGEQNAPNNWQLESDPLPPMEESAGSSARLVRAAGVEAGSAFPNAALSIPAHAKARLLLDQSQLTTAYPLLTVSGGAGALVRLTYAEALVNEKGEKGNRDEIQGKHIEGLVDEFLPSGSASEEFIPLSWRAWRYLQIDVDTTDSPVRIGSFRTQFTAFPFIEQAKFKSSDPSLQSIWDIGWRTARLDAHDTYMDTPYWERLQYVGDARIQALVSYVVAGDDRLARQAIRAFDNSRITDGITQSRYPSSLVQIIPTFSLLWIGMLDDFWMYRGDAEFVRAHLPGTRTVLDWFLQHQRADGLLDRIPWWPFVDWGSDFAFGVPQQDDNGGSAVITLQFIEALRHAAEMERELGDPLRAASYGRAADHAAEGVRNLCWNATYGLLADTPAQTHFSQHANILGVWLDVISAAQQRTVLTKVLSTSDHGFGAHAPVPSMTAATYYFRFYAARAVEHAGMGDQYLQLLGPWRDMMSLGLTTWAESPEPTRSDSHAWSAHPNYDLLTIVAGIRPKTPGFGEILLEPHLGSLDHVNSAMPTPSGIVEVQFDRTVKGVRAQVKLPTNRSGEMIWNGKRLELHPGTQRLMLP